jgi:hypothetical protein
MRRLTDTSMISVASMLGVPAWSPTSWHRVVRTLSRRRVCLPATPGSFRFKVEGPREKETNMDADRFDAISRALGSLSRRRGMLRAVAGGALGLAGLSALTDNALARSCDKDKDCNGDDVCRNGKCVECKNDNDCSGKDICSNNKCVACEKNSDCKSNQRCKNNNCVKK